VSTILDLLQATCGLLVVLVARLGLVFAVAAVLVTPVALALGARSFWRWLRARMRGLLRVGNVLFRPDVRYAAGHTWIERDGASARIGIDGIAQDILPWALAVRLPEVGESLVEGQIAAVISCGAGEASFAAPLSGRVVAVNAAVANDPSLVKEDGFGRGWLYVLSRRMPATAPLLWVTRHATGRRPRRSASAASTRPGSVPCGGSSSAGRRPCSRRTYGRSSRASSCARDAELMVRGAGRTHEGRPDAQEVRSLTLR
jgi:glycine cleavage system H lipoate-binding protein